MPPSFQRSTPRDCTGPSRGAASRWLCGPYARRASCALANILDSTDGRRSWRSRRSPSSPCFGWSLPLRFGAGDGIRCWGSARVLGHGYGCPEHILEVAVHFPEDFFGPGDVAFLERLTCHRQALIEAAQLLHPFLTRSPVLHSPLPSDCASALGSTAVRHHDQVRRASARSPTRLFRRSRRGCTRSGVCNWIESDLDGRQRSTDRYAVGSCAD